MSESEENEGSESVDDEVIEAVEDIHDEGMLVEFGKESGPSELEFVREWFPESEDYRGKTNITPKQARQLALIRNLEDSFPHIVPSSTQAVLNEITDNYERYLTSVEGDSRIQQTSILKSLFGSGNEEMERAQSMLMGAISKDLVEENDE